MHGTIFHIDYHYKYCKRYLPVGLVIRPSPIVLAIDIAVVGDLMFAKRVTNKRVCPRQFALPNSCRYKYQHNVLVCGKHHVTHIHILMQRFRSAGCDNSRTQRTGGTPNLWSGTSLFLGKYHIGVRGNLLFAYLHFPCSNN